MFEGHEEEAPQQVSSILQTIVCSVTFRKMQVVVNLYFNGRHFPGADNILNNLDNIVGREMGSRIDADEEMTKSAFAYG